MQIRIEGSHLPGRKCPPAANLKGFTNIHVGVQRRDEPKDLLDLYAGDEPSAIWSLHCEAVTNLTGRDIRGHYVQGPPGDRFIYLSWGDIDKEGTFVMFRQAKLMLNDVPPSVLKAARKSGSLVARLSLSDAEGLPLGGRVPAESIEWTAG